MSIKTDEREKMTIAVIGGGAFGTSIAQVAARCGHTVKMYARNQEVVESINTKHINPHYLSEFTLLDTITATSSVEEVFKDTDFVVLALPTQLVMHPLFIMRICLYIHIVRFHLG